MFFAGNPLGEAHRSWANENTRRVNVYIYIYVYVYTVPRYGCSFRRHLQEGKTNTPGYFASSFFFLLFPPSFFKRTKEVSKMVGNLKVGGKRAAGY